MFAPIAGKEDPRGCGHVLVLTGGPLFPPLTQQAQDVSWQHHVAVFATFRLNKPNDLLGAVDIADLEPHDYNGLRNRAFELVEEVIGKDIVLGRV